MGYIPREVAQVLALEMDTGSRFDGIVTAVETEPGVPRVVVRITQSQQA